MRSTVLPSSPFPVRLARVCALACAAVSAACSVDEIISTTEPVTGPGTVYALVSANDVPLPAAFTLDASRYEIRQGALTLGTDSTFIFSIALRTSVNGGQSTNRTSTFRGTFARAGALLTLRQQAETLFVGTYSPNSVALQRGRAEVVGDRFVFAR